MDSVAQELSLESSGSDESLDPYASGLSSVSNGKKVCTGGLGYIPRCDICNDLEFRYWPPKNRSGIITLADIRAGADEKCHACFLILQASLSFKYLWEELDEADLIILLNFIMPPNNGELILFIKYMDGRPEEFWVELFIQDTSDCGTKYPTIPRRALVSESPASERSMQQLIRWVQTCRNEHPLCNQSQSSSQMPRRVLEVLSPTGGDLIRLREMEDQEFPYSTLSHCWGQESDGLPLRTTKENIKTHKHSFCWDDLSQTFRDAVTTTRKLGIRYLWIDSLCIIQDDKKDWQEQAAKMAAIYTNSALTIAAIGASHGGIGFLSQPREVVKLQQSSTVGMGSRHDFFAQLFHGAHHIYSGTLGYHDSHRLQGEHTPLYRRGWCVQERYLSTRMVQYGKSEMIWQCKTALECECSGNTPSSFLSFGNRFDAALHSVSSSKDGIWLWKSVVESFTSTQLSKASDVLPALSGLAAIFQEFKWGKYVAGLWEQTIIQDLCWYRVENSEEDKECYTAPSFSWASSVGQAKWWDGRETFGDGFSQTPMCELIDFQTDTRMGIPLGEVTSGFVKLKGFMIPVVFSKIFDTGFEASIPSYTYREGLHMDHVNTLGGELPDTFCFPVMGSLRKDSLDVQKLYFSTLLLERLPSGFYRRIGFLEQHTMDAVQLMPSRSFCGVRRQHITII